MGSDRGGLGWYDRDHDRFVNYAAGTDTSRGLLHAASSG